MIDTPQKELMNALLSTQKDEEQILACLAKVTNIHFFMRTKQGVHYYPSYLAAHFGLERVMDTLIEKGAPIKIKDKNGCNPLHIAQAKGHFSIAQMLAEAEPSLCTMGDKKGATPLHYAAQLSDDCYLNLYLRASSCDVNEVRDDAGATPLHWAAKKGQEAAVDTLMSVGARSSVIDKLNRKPADHCPKISANQSLIDKLRKHESSLFELCSAFIADKPELQEQLPEVVLSQQTRASTAYFDTQAQRKANQPHVAQTAEDIIKSFERLKLD